MVAGCLALVAGCGGGPSAAPAPEPTAPSSDAATATAPAELALVDLGFELAGPERIVVEPGGETKASFVFANPTEHTLTVRFELSGDERVELVDATGRLRALAGQTDTFAMSVAVPADAAAGERLAVEVAVVEVGASEHRSVVPLVVEVGDGSGRAPVVGYDDAATTTNERVSSYVVFDDTDPDGDLDVTTVRVLGGAALAEDVTADPSGTITYVPFTNLTGVDHVLYEVCDTTGRCGTGVLRVEIA
jgi:hypothetical protein